MNRARLIGVIKAALNRMQWDADLLVQEGVLSADEPRSKEQADLLIALDALENRNVEQT